MTDQAKLTAEDQLRALVRAIPAVTRPNSASQFLGASCAMMAQYDAARQFLADPDTSAASPRAATGEPDELNLYDDKVQTGIAWTMRQWGETLGLTTWDQGDGSESVEGDVGAEIHTILVEAGLRDPETNEMATLRPTDTEMMKAEIERLTATLNTPEVDDFVKGAVSEAQHQRERWGSEHDAGKQPLDWFWLIGFLAQKAAMSQMAGDTDKALHHTISTAAALANWHAAISGQHTAMRPGIATPAGDEPGAAVPENKAGQ